MLLLHPIFRGGPKENELVNMDSQLFRKGYEFFEKDGQYHLYVLRSRHNTKDESQKPSVEVYYLGPFEKLTESESIPFEIPFNKLPITYEDNSEALIDLVFKYVTDRAKLKRIVFLSPGGERIFKQVFHINSPKEQIKDFINCALSGHFDSEHNPDTET